MEINYIKLYDDAIEPKRSHGTDAGLDLFCRDEQVLWPGKNALFSTGIAMDIPAGYVGLIWPRSGLAIYGIDTLAGVVDSGYHGDIIVNLVNHGNSEERFHPGNKIAQILIQRIQLPTLRQVSQFAKSDRGTAGHGSTG